MPRRRMPLEQAEPLADALGKLWGELLATRHALWQREAELAAGVPLVLRRRRRDMPPLGERLEAVLRGGAEAIGCQAAALYLLDPATTELKLRSSWGLPRKRLTDPARPLRGALADLEALLGHAVVLTDDRVARLLESAREGLSLVRLRAGLQPVDAAGHAVGLLQRARATSATRRPTFWKSWPAAWPPTWSARCWSTRRCRPAIRRNKSPRPSDRNKNNCRGIAPMIEGWEIAAKAYHCRPGRRHVLRLVRARRRRPERVGRRCDVSAASTAR